MNLKIILNQLIQYREYGVTVAQGSPKPLVRVQILVLSPNF